MPSQHLQRRADGFLLVLSGHAVDQVPGSHRPLRSVRVLFLQNKRIPLIGGAVTLQLASEGIPLVGREPDVGVLEASRDLPDAFDSAPDTLYDILIVTLSLLGSS